MSRTLTLLRHGRTDYNATGRMQGLLDIPLDDVGRAEVGEVTPGVRALAPGAVVSSDLLRARQTAEIIGLPFELDPRLREVDLGTWQGLTLEEVRERFPDEYAAWRRGEDVRRGGGETYAELADRAVPALLEAVDAAPGGSLLAVLHGGTARAATARLLDLPPEAWWRLAGLGNVTWTRLENTGRGWRLIEHGSRPVSGGQVAG